MNDTELGNSLRSLPHATASAAFTSDVLRTIRERQTSLSAAREAAPAFHWIWRTAAGVAMAGCLILVVALASLQHERRQAVAELRAEQQKLSAELQAVKQSASEPEPVVVFENTDGTRVIMDLDSAAQPVSYRTFD